MKNKELSKSTSSAWLTTLVWWRAQGFYAALNTAGALLYALLDGVAGHAADAWAGFPGLALLSILFAMVCGLPAWLLMMLTMMMVDKAGGRRRLLTVTMLGTGLLFTALALFVGFGLVLDGLAPATDPAVMTFCALAFVSMGLSVFSLRGAIARYAGEDAAAPTSLHRSAEE